jgi:hypothetical protein
VEEEQDDAQHGGNGELVQNGGNGELVQNGGNGELVQNDGVAPVGNPNGAD